MRNKIQQKKKEEKRGKSEGGGYGDGQVRLDWRRVVDRYVVD